MDVKTKELLTTEAARWYARLHAFDCSDADREACRAWRRLSAEHDRAFVRAEQTAAQITQGLRTDARLQALAAAALGKPAEPALAPASHWTATHWRIAAALVVSAIVGLIATTQLTNRTAHETISSFNNTTNAQQQIALTDGSVMYLDAGSRVNAHISATQRRVELLAGRAYFEVVHDTTRPFWVDAAGVRTTDIGTRFQIALDHKLVSVTLTEGSVAVSDRLMGDRWTETLIPGEQLKVSTDSGIKHKLNVDTTAVTSWSHGRLIFKDSPLSEALDELNRYAATKIRLGDASLAAIPIGGDFIAGGNSEQVVDALAALLPLRVVYAGPNEIVLFHRYEIETP